MKNRTRTASELVVGVDLGGTNMQIGVVNAANEIIGRDRRKTNARQGARSVMKNIADGIRAACDSANIPVSQLKAVGIAAPGAIDIPRGVVLAAPNLRWRNVALCAAMTQLLRRPVVIDNDVNAAVWGEYKLGAAQGSKTEDVLGVWLGTGVGGGLVINGKLFHGEFFTAGEVGQTVIEPDGEKGRRILEDFCSRTGMSRTIVSRIKKFPKSSLRDAISKSEKTVGSRQLAQAFRDRDSLAVEVVTEAADLLGIAIANWITVLAMDTVIIGGGVTEALGEAFLRMVRASFRRDVFPDRCRRAKLIITRLQDDAGLLGAALLAREKGKR